MSYNTGNKKLEDVETMLLTLSSIRKINVSLKSWPDFCFSSWPTGNEAKNNFKTVLLWLVKIIFMLAPLHPHSIYFQVSLRGKDKDNNIAWFVSDLTWVLASERCKVYFLLKHHWQLAIHFVKIYVATSNIFDILRNTCLLGSMIISKCWYNFATT
jgi:hypothetical protein